MAAIWPSGGINIAGRHDSPKRLFVVSLKGQAGMVISNGTTITMRTGENDLDRGYDRTQPPTAMDRP
ncbi:MAG: hypothetical protein BZY83_08540 [SAR202 cluster bacterium Casp-Chloro-G2]|nr:MAG: hypothetical protein BZY83_08540 [SAR202 cluster bacterium Casp-Chloro-G2]